MSSPSHNHELPSIYAPDALLSNEELSNKLAKGLIGFSLFGLPNRTRSKIGKEKICEILGYNIPISFKKTKPRFICQNFDCYFQKSTNLQIWNEEVLLDRRYVIIRLDDNDCIAEVKVLSGEELCILDKTGKLTSKYQSKLKNCYLGKNIKSDDSELVRKESITNINCNQQCNPCDCPSSNSLLSIDALFELFKEIIGIQIPNLGASQERNRAALLHKIVCEKLGYLNYADLGNFPDIPHQLLEVKLQTSPTVDLGLYLPNDNNKLRNILLGENSIKVFDIRYAIFYGTLDADLITIKNFNLINGEHFFEYYNQFKGKNSKIQIPIGQIFKDQMPEKQGDQFDLNI